MRAWKRLISFVVAFALCLIVLPSTAFAADDFVIQNGVLIEYIGSGGDVIIPAGVTEIGDEVFSHSTSLTSVTIPGSVKTIGFEAFYACTNLSNVTIANGVSVIGHSAFAMCFSLSSITIPDSVTEIEQYAFWACESLRNVKIGNGLVSIGYKAFADCDNLTNIDIPAGVTIASSAFASTPVEEVGGTPTGAGLIAMLPSPPPEVIIPVSISEVEYWSHHDDQDWSLPQSKESVFQQIKSLVKQLTEGKSSETEKAKAIYNWVTSNISYDWEDYRGGESTSKGDAFYVYYYRTGVCGGYAILAHFMLTLAGFPVAYIAGDAGGPHAWNAVYADGRWIEFDATCGMWDLPPSYHSSIDNISFRNGVLLEVIRDDGAIDCQMWNLYDYPSEITIPAGITKVTFIDMDNLTKVTLPNGMTEISTCAFEKCTSLTNVVLPASITTIGYRAFAYCSNLTSIPISNSVTKIDEGAFSYCTGLTNVTLPDSVTQIGNTAFSYCTNLSSVTIPASVTKIGMSAFYSCTGLKNVVIANGNAEIGELAFSKHYSSSGYHSMPDVTVYSTAGGKVEQYCKENEISFVSVADGFTDTPDVLASTNNSTQQNGGTDQKPQTINDYKSGQFSDVPVSSWYAEYVKIAYEHGIMDGVGNNSFDPDGSLSVASAIAIACRFHSQYNKTNAVFSSGTPWYQPYVEYAQKNRIIDSSKEYAYDDPITRAEFALLISNALPDSALEEINEIWGCDIPDVSTGSPYMDAVNALANAGILTSDNAFQIYFLSVIYGDSLGVDNAYSTSDTFKAIYRLYRAGILTGNDQYGTFTPDAEITRSAVAAIVSRVAEPTERKHITLTPKPVQLVPMNQLNNLSSIRQKATNAQLTQAYEAAKEIAEPLANLSREAQLCGISLVLRIITENEVAYSMSAPHYDDPYGFFILHTASCAGCTRATGLCLNMLGIPYEHVNENAYSHQWTRVNVNGTYWICDAYGLYCGPEEVPYQHPDLS